MSIERYIESREFHSFEGERGVQRFEEVVKALDYDNLREFFADNPGAVNAVLEWLDMIKDFRQQFTALTPSEEGDDE